MKRREFLTGGLSGASLLLLTACTSPKPPPRTPAPTTTPAALPTPTAFARSAWSVDPFALGAQSYLSVGATEANRATLATPVDDRLFFAGEAVAAHEPGTVAGARASGLAVATKVAAAAADGDRIAIIGAGMAGAIAARQLTAAGFDVVVLEARNRVGGRIDTVTGEGWPFPVERGAFVVADVAGSPIVGELASLQVATKLLDHQEETRTEKGEVVTPPAVGPTLVGEAVAWARAADADVSLDAALGKVGAADLSRAPGASGVSEAEWLRHYLVTNVEDQNGAPVDKLSARIGWEAETGSERVVVGGYQSVVRSALADLDVRLSSVVTSISYGKGAIGIRIASGESLQADRVIVTVPLGVLKTEAITFDPVLPADHLQAVDALGMGFLEKVVLSFDKPFWQTDAQIWSIVGAETAFAQWVNLQPLTGKAVLVGMAVADDAERVAKLDDNAVKALALSELAAFAGH